MIDIEKLSASVPRNDDEYLAEDGLIHCRKCGEQLETIITIPWAGDKKVRCICSCTIKEKEAAREQERQEDRERNRRICFSGSTMAKKKFGNSEHTEYINIAKKYAEHFEEMREKGKGIIFYGTVGTGKSHLAACIANEVIDKDFTALMTNFATVINILQSSFDGRQRYIDSLNRFDLLVIDDLGTERQSEYMQEQVFNIIDSRYRSGLPFIITTNLPPEELKKTTDIGNGRIYDRILERCHPVAIQGQSYRRQKLKEDYKQMEMLLKG